MEMWFLFKRLEMRKNKVWVQNIVTGGAEGINEGVGIDSS